MITKMNIPLAKIAISCLISAILTNCKPTSNEHDLEFNLNRIPFSYKGAGLSLSTRVDTMELTIIDVSGNNGGYRGKLFGLRYLIDDAIVKPEVTATPGKASIYINGKKYGEACFESDKIFRLRGNSIPVRIDTERSFTDADEISITQISDAVYHVQGDFIFGTTRYILSCHEGSLDYDKEESILILSPSENNYFEISLEETDSTWNATGLRTGFKECIELSRNSFQSWLSGMPSVSEEYAQSRCLASYILWSCTLSEGGNLKRPGILMSKFGMNAIWSWDHCFNAIACSYQMPEMAWDQFMLVFDHQDEKGQIPDCFGRGRMVTRFVKPPIHGWALRMMMENMELNGQQLDHAYFVLKKWTNYWFDYRDSNNNGLPEYYHGNDSGWDNNTEFSVDGQRGLRAPRESANLYAYLVLQMDVLQELAMKSGKPDEADMWRQKSDTLLSLMITESWNGKRFLTRNLETDTINLNSQSLMAYLPLVLGEKLPSEIRDQLVDELQHAGYLTPFGLASENPDSPNYEEDGYWRGPIWAPPVIIIVDGLHNAGEHELAHDIAQRFCDMCAQNGFAENFNALTGEGLREQAYTWTASIFLILAHEYLTE